MLDLFFSHFSSIIFRKWYSWKHPQNTTQITKSHFVITIDRICVLFFSLCSLDSPWWNIKFNVLLNILHLLFCHCRLYIDVISVCERCYHKNRRRMRFDGKRKRNTRDSIFFMWTFQLSINWTILNTMNRKWTFNNSICGMCVDFRFIALVAVCVCVCSILGERYSLLRCFGV